MSWLVTGGAGYIGSHVVRAFASRGIDVVVVDDLSSGRRSFLPRARRSCRARSSTGPARGDLRALQRRGSRAPGRIQVRGRLRAASAAHLPAERDGHVTLLAAMEARGVDRMVFSSSAAVYGTPDVDLVTEDTPKRPQSPYGESKLVGEWLIADQGVATGLRHTSLRYFNVVGSGTPQHLRRESPQPLPTRVRRAARRAHPSINGNDYATPDGTNVRDYLHVADLAEAHVVAAERLDSGKPIEPSTTSARAPAFGRRDHARGRRRHGHRVHSRDRASPHGRSRAHRRLGRPRRPRPGMAHAALARRRWSKAPGRPGARHPPSSEPTGWASRRET